MANFWGGIESGSTSVIFRCSIYKADDGQPFTGLTNSSSGLIISTITDNEASATSYAQASSNTETIATLATYAAPSTSKCRVKLVDDTNQPGLIEIQLADARWAVASAKDLFITISGVANLLAVTYRVALDTVSEQDITGLFTSYGLPNTTQLNARTLPSGEYATNSAVSSVDEKLPNTLTSAGNIRANVSEVNEGPVSGTGTVNDPWGPA